MKLTDLTKDELITLVNRQFIPPTERELAGIRWERLQNEAGKKRVESMAISKKATGSKGFWEGQLVWDEADALTKRADKVYEKYLG